MRTDEAGCALPTTPGPAAAADEDDDDDDDDDCASVAADAVAVVEGVVWMTFHSFTVLSRDAVKKCVAHGVQATA